MPYKGNDLSMLIFLPNDIEDDTTGLEKVRCTYQYFNVQFQSDKLVTLYPHSWRRS